ncbi:hypothetical protein WA158_003970 [Blastocystis sp. Blastoise]
MDESFNQGLLQVDEFIKDTHNVFQSGDEETKFKKLTYINEVLMMSPRLMLLPSFVQLINDVRHFLDSNTNIPLCAQALQFISITIDNGFSVMSYGTDFLKKISGLFYVDSDSVEINELYRLLISIFLKCSEENPDYIINSGILSVLLDKIPFLDSFVAIDVARIFDRCTTVAKKNQVNKMAVYIPDIINYVSTENIQMLRLFISSIDSLVTISQRSPQKTVFVSLSRNRVIDKLLDILLCNSCSSDERLYICEKIVRIIGICCKNSRVFCDHILEMDCWNVLYSSFSRGLIKDNISNDIFVKNTNVTIPQVNLYINFIRLFNFFAQLNDSSAEVYNPELINTVMDELSSRFYVQTLYLLYSSDMSLVSETLIYLNNIMKYFDCHHKSNICVYSIELITQLNSFDKIDINNVMRRTLLLNALIVFQQRFYSDFMLNSISVTSISKKDIYESQQNLNKILDQFDTSDSTTDDAHTLELKRIILDNWVHSNTIELYTKREEEAKQALIDIFTYINTSKSVSPFLLTQTKLIHTFINILKSIPLDKDYKSREHRVKIFLDALYSLSSNPTSKYIQSFLDILLQGISFYICNFPISSSGFPQRHADYFNTSISINLVPYVVPEEDSKLLPNLFTKSTQVSILPYKSLYDVLEVIILNEFPDLSKDMMKRASLSYTNTFDNVRVYYGNTLLSIEDCFLKSIYMALPSEDPTKSNLSLLWKDPVSLQLYCCDSRSLPYNDTADVVLNKEIDVVKLEKIKLLDPEGPSVLIRRLDDAFRNDPNNIMTDDIDIDDESDDAGIRQNNTKSTCIVCDSKEEEEEKEKNNSLGNPCSEEKEYNDREIDTNDNNNDDNNNTSSHNVSFRSKDPNSTRSYSSKEEEEEEEKEKEIIKKKMRKQKIEEMKRKRNEELNWIGIRLDNDMVELLQYLNVLYIFNKYISEYGMYELWDSQDILLLPSSLSIPESSFISPSVNGVLVKQLKDTIIILAHAYPSWLQYLLNHYGFMFNFFDKQNYFYYTAFYTLSLIRRLKDNNMISRKIPSINSTIRFVVQRYHAIMDMTYLGNVVGSRFDIQIQFFNEEGVGQGPTREFVSLVTKEIQRQELGIWRNSEHFIYSSARMMNYPVFGPGEDEEDLTVLEHSICGVYTRCSDCLRINMYACPEHKSLLKHNRANDSMYCPLCSYQILLNTVTCPSCGASPNKLKPSWFYLYSDSLDALHEFFNNHPDLNTAYLGINECNICDAIFIPYISDKRLDANNISSYACLTAKQQNKFHLHSDKDLMHFSCVVRCKMDRSVLTVLDEAFQSGVTTRYNPDISRMSINVEKKYVKTTSGLFPAPLYTFPATGFEESKIIWFSFGVMMGFSLFFSLPLDLYLSPYFIKFLVHRYYTVNSMKQGIHDLCQLVTEQSNTLQALYDAYRQYINILHDKSISAEHKSELISALTVNGASFEDLALTFEYPSSTFNMASDICREEVPPVDIRTLPLYLSRLISFSLVHGVEAIFDLMRQGFSKICNVSRLEMFTDQELNLFLNGEDEEWTRDLLEHNIYPKSGYDKTSRQFHDLVDILLTFDADQKQKFLQFCTGSRKLPVGGLATLVPALNIVPKDCSKDSTDDTLPSTSTCTATLKMPRYSSKEQMEKQLNRAIIEGLDSFHLF